MVQLKYQEPFLSKHQPSFQSFSFTDQHDAVIQIQVVQPLLKNMFGKVDRYPLKVRHIQKKLAELKYNSDRNYFYLALPKGAEELC